MAVRQPRRAKEPVAPAATREGPPLEWLTSGPEFLRRYVLSIVLGPPRARLGSHGRRPGAR